MCLIGEGIDLKVFLIIDELVSVAESAEQEDLQNLIKKLKTTIIEEDIRYINADAQILVSRSLQGAEDIRKIIFNLKCFTHSGDEHKSEFDLNECIEQTLLVTWSEIKNICDVEKSLDKLKPTLGYPKQINQVIMNLLLNAVQAVKDKGQIKITSYYQNGCNIINIRDNGKGISKIDIDNIFNPFFTTKPVGIGTGLGLSISYSIIVENHGGTIKVESEEDNFTEFTISLPAISL